MGEALYQRERCCLRVGETFIHTGGGRLGVGETFNHWEGCCLGNYIPVRPKVEKASAIWFVSKLNGYRIEELAIFTDALYRYLKLNYSKDFVIDPSFCTSVDIINLNKLSYAEMVAKEIPFLLNSTLDSINKVIDKK